MHHGATWIVSLAALVLLGFALVYALKGGVPSALAPQPQTQACTQEAVRCPDGSYVSRVAPSCNVAACPGEGALGGAISARINQGASARGLKIVPLEVLEDSRCAAGVQCIWAGQIRVRSLVVRERDSAQSEAAFTIGSAAVLYGVSVTLTAASPYPQAGKYIAPFDYLFTFTLAGSAS